MLALFRLVRGRGMVILLLLAVAAAGSPTLRARATRLLACTVSLQAGDPTGGLGATAASMFSGTRVRRSSPGQCLREAMASTTMARQWIQHRRDGR